MPLVRAVYNQTTGNLLRTAVRLYLNSNDSRARDLMKISRSIWPALIEQGWSRRRHHFCSSAMVRKGYSFVVIGIVHIGTRSLLMHWRSAPGLAARNSELITRVSKLASRRPFGHHPEVATDHARDLRGRSVARHPAGWCHGNWRCCLARRPWAKRPCAAVRLPSSLAAARGAFGGEWIGQPQRAAAHL